MNCHKHDDEIHSLYFSSILNVWTISGRISYILIAQLLKNRSLQVKIIEKTSQNVCDIFDSFATILYISVGPRSPAPVRVKNVVKVRSCHVLLGSVPDLFSVGLLLQLRSRLVLQKVASELHPKVRNHGEGPY